MTVREFLELFIDEDSQYFELYDNTKNKIVFKGYLDELSEDLEYATVSSIDNIYECDKLQTKGVTINIDIE